MTETPSRVCIGIDPGLTGAIAAVSPDGDYLRLVDMPLRSEGKRKVLDEPELVESLFALSSMGTHSPLCVVEHQQSMPKQGVTSVFSLGYQYGVIMGVLAAFNIPHRVLKPQEWKRFYSLGRDKDKARAIAGRLYPKQADLFRARIQGHGRAEALLMARLAAFGPERDAITEGGARVATHPL